MFFAFFLQLARSRRFFCWQIFSIGMAVEDRNSLGFNAHFHNQNDFMQTHNKAKKLPTEKHKKMEK